MRYCRWLNNEQALEDSANLMRNVKFEDIDEDFTAPNTPWMYYRVRVLPPVSRGGSHFIVNGVAGVICRRTGSSYASSLPRSRVWGYCVEWYAPQFIILHMRHSSKQNFPAHKR